MRKKCSESGCTAPKGLCKKFTSPAHQQCPRWNQSEEEESTTKKLSKGIHIVTVKNCKGKMCKRKVKVLANGQWRFMKMGKTKK